MLDILKIALQPVDYVPEVNTPDVCRMPSFLLFNFVFDTQTLISQMDEWCPTHAKYNHSFIIGQIRETDSYIFPCLEGPGASLEGRGSGPPEVTPSRRVTPD